MGCTSQWQTEKQQQHTQFKPVHKHYHHSGLTQWERHQSLDMQFWLARYPATFQYQYQRAIKWLLFQYLVASLTKNTANINKKQTKPSPGLVASYDLRPGNGAGPYSGR